MTEEKVYLGSKNYLINNGYTVIAGQPPRGVDHLPVIEIKDTNPDKGSKSAYKPDLVAYKNGTFFIIECKPSFSYDDYLKLKSILNSPIRIHNFYIELHQYHLLEKVNYCGSFNDFTNNLQISLAYSGKMNDTYTDIHHIIVSDWRGIATSTLN